LGSGVVPLACSVRGCHQPLTRRGDACVCERGHSFDIARSGYLNLLQPQDRRSRAPGDAAAALDARARLLAAGVGASILAGFVERAATVMESPADAVVLDLGCGTGEALERVAGTVGAHGVGIDISVEAIERAARRAPSLTWVVANADRRLPLLDARVALAMSFNARRSPAECARVLAHGGRLLVAVPAPDDLIELRALVQGAGVPRERADAVAQDHAPFFALEARQTLREQHALEGPALRDLLEGTYRGARHSQQAQHDAVTRLDVTLAADVLTFVRN
jgi:23S rRNA (guanine745-N1)-methyltransferase